MRAHGELLYCPRCGDEVYPGSQPCRNCLPYLDDLGRILGRWFQIAVDETEAHDDVAAWNAPGECHADVAMGYDRKRKEFAEDLMGGYGITLSDLLDIAEQRTGWQVGRLEELYFRHFYTYHFA